MKTLAIKFIPALGASFVLVAGLNSPPAAHATTDLCSPLAQEWVGPAQCKLQQQQNPGSGQPGTQVAQADPQTDPQVAGAGPPTGNMNDQLFPQGPPPPPPPTYTKPPVTLCPINSCGVG